jgi:polysaccharide export outer membrane protein
MLFHRCFFGNLTPVKFSKLLIASILISWLITGCSSLRPTQMLPTYLDSVYTALPALSIQEVSIEAGDRLEITFAGKSVEVTAALNNYGVSKVEDPTTITSGKSAASSIEVDKDGFIELPLIGKLKVAGKTRSELKVLLTKEASKYLVDPIVYLGGLSKKISVLGQVKMPSTKEFFDARVSIFEALAMAGDVTDYAVIEKVKVYRDVNGKRELGNINLADSSMFNSPYFYLRNNDMVFVPAQSERLAYARRNQTLPIVSVALGLAGILLALTTVFVR